MINSVLLPIFAVESILCLLSLIFLIIELKSMSAVIFNRKTLLLIGFLISLTSAYLTRSIGIFFSHNGIRLFGPTLSAVFGGMFIIAWATSIVGIKREYQQFLVTSFVIGLFIFLTGRWLNNFILEFLGLIFSMTIIIGVILRMFFFAFQKSPYIKARQRVFGMMIGFIGFSIFEVFAVIAMSKEQFYLSAILFLFELPFRLILTMSILLPKRVIEIMSRWIN